MNKVKRYVAAEFVGMASLALVSANHSLWRACVTNKAGLTPKEIELLAKKREDLLSLQLLLSKVAHRLRQSGRCT